MNLMYFETELDLYKIDVDDKTGEYHCLFKMKDTGKTAKKTVNNAGKAIDLIWEIMETSLDSTKEELCH